MPVLKNQDVKCLNCQTILHAVMGQIETLTCECESVIVEVNQNYINTSGASEIFEITHIEELPETFIELKPKTPVVRPENEDELWRAAALLREGIERVRELEWELRRILEIVDETRI